MCEEEATEGTDEEAAEATAGETAGDDVEVLCILLASEL